MSIAKVTKICMECGSSFEWRKRCRNWTEARGTEEWATKEDMRCPRCYAKKMSFL